MELSGSALEFVGAFTSPVHQPLLQVRDLRVQLSVDAIHEIHPVNKVSFEIQTGEVVALVGESGAGKTTLAMALMCLLPAKYHVSGSVGFDGLELLSLGHGKLRRVRGSRLSLIYQDSAVLNPVLRIGTQLTEILRAHRHLSRQERAEKARSLLEDVELRDVDRIFAAFPHQLSGGQRQRIVIAQALACGPALVIADEPTASLDPAVAADILNLLGRLTQRFGTSILLISHDLAPVALLSDRVMVMYAGKIVEQGPCREVLQRPLHPYTQALLECVLPVNDFPRRRAATIPGPSEAMQSDHGCDFEQRCKDRMAICKLRSPRQVELSTLHTIRCFKFGADD